jgi:(1->4)-alpha-D-glucan 1-alpha-D-glucosylmutase
MTATYRLQLTPDFGFTEAEALGPYLNRLGASHLYLSPITEARPGSTHGYDVTDHNRVREAFGGRRGRGRQHARPPGAPDRPGRGPGHAPARGPVKKTST